MFQVQKKWWCFNRHLSPHLFVFAFLKFIAYSQCIQSMVDMPVQSVCSVSGRHFRAINSISCCHPISSMSVNTASNETTYKRAVQQIRSNIKQCASLPISCWLSHILAGRRTKPYRSTLSMFLRINCRRFITYLTNKIIEGR